MLAAGEPDVRAAALPAGQSLHVHAADVPGGEWLVRHGADGITVQPEHSKATVALRGPAPVLLLVLLRRLPLDDPAVQVLGDQQVLKGLAGGHRVLKPRPGGYSSRACSPCCAFARPRPQYAFGVDLPWLQATFREHLTQPEYHACLAEQVGVPAAAAAPRRPAPRPVPPGRPRPGCRPPRRARPRRTGQPVQLSARRWSPRSCWSAGSGTSRKTMARGALQRAGHRGRGGQPRLVGREQVPVGGLADEIFPRGPMPSMRPGARGAHPLLPRPSPCRTMSRVSSRCPGIQGPDRVAAPCSGRRPSAATSSITSWPGRVAEP